MGIVNKLKEKLEHTHINIPPKNFHVGKGDFSTIKETIPTTIDTRTIYRNRFNNGVNLGALFVLEPWIFDSKLNECGGDCEFECISNMCKKKSSDEAVKRLQNHYETYISRINWDWLNKNGITALRVPIGYWHVDNGSFTDGLPFESLKGIYSQCKPWDTFKKLIERANQHKIGILIDIHGLPGGANTDSHSGEKSGNASFFQNSKYVDKMVNEVIPFIVKELPLHYENIIGLQIVNEAKFDEKGKDEQKYYEKAIKAINKIDPNLPIIISDGWWPEQWADWLQKTNSDSSVIVDTHIYRCFSDEDKSKSAEQIIKDLNKTVNLPYDKADFMVGEFSCVLDEQTWSKTKGDRKTWVEEFGKEQIKTFNKVASWGWFFWTLQFQWGDGGEWGIVPQVNNAAIPIRNKKQVNIDSGAIQSIVSEHVNYWDDKGDRFEHERFMDGLNQAIDDIKNFNKFDSSRIGRLHAWVATRRSQYIKEHGDSEFMWEWDQGYQRGLSEFNH